MLMLIFDSDDMINLVLAPPTGVDFNVAKLRALDVINTAKADENWSYDDVKSILATEGFTIHDFKYVCE